ncbi:MAG: phage terminase large subunit family protein [Magnetococcales bacterium]|nr:phage terminase large subunit family protein [Magnetococcales bacterium]
MSLEEISQYFKGEKDVIDIIIRAIRPDPVMTVSEWADKYRWLSAKDTPEPGRWTTARVPYLREIMDCLSPASRIQKVVLMKSTQIGFTAGIIGNAIGYYVDAVPAPIMVVQPTEKAAKRWSKQRLSPLIQETPRLREKISGNSRDGGNTLLLKDFPGGFINVVGANSPTDLSSTPTRIMLLDEVDRYPWDVDGEGNPIILAEKRTSRFKSNKKIVMGSTPTGEGVSHIASHFRQTDQRYYHVPCPYCGGMQPLDFENLSWIEGKSESVRYKCRECEKEIPESYKGMMLENGQWVASQPDLYDGKTAGYHLNALYVPLGWDPGWFEILEEHRKAVKEEEAGDPGFLYGFENTVLAKTSKRKGEGRPDREELEKLTELYQNDAADMPSKALKLTMGVDTQNDRLAVVVRAWGPGMESWLVYWDELIGDPNEDEVWKQLSVLIDRGWEHPSGQSIQVSSVSIDSGGGRTQAVYEYARLTQPLVAACKGASTYGKPVFGRASDVDVRWDGKVRKGAVKLYQIGTDTAKDIIYQRLQKTLNSERVSLAGVYHFYDGVGSDYFKQLTSEIKVPIYSGRRKQERWTVHPTGARNEALDCEVLALAGAYRLGIHRWDENRWASEAAEVLQPTLMDVVDDGRIERLMKANSNKKRRSIRRKRG